MTDTTGRRRLAPQDRRLLLMEAAARTFARLGFAGARMEDVATEAGVAKGLLYRYFPSKEALFQALMEDLGAEFTGRLRLAWRDVLTGDDPSPWATIDAGLRVFLAEATRPGTMLNWVEPAQWELVSRFRDQTLQAIVEQLAAFTPALDEQTAWLVAALFQGALEGGILEWRRRGGMDTESVFALARTFVSRGLEGLRQQLDLGLPELPQVERPS